MTTDINVVRDDGKASYYVYIYLDPRKPGMYHYPELSFYPGYFEYEPFYVGKGIRKRDQHHLRVAQGYQKCSRWENTYKINKIRAILNQGLTPIIVHPFMLYTTEGADKLEELCILTIGRLLDKSGPLVNKAVGDPFKGHLVLTGEQHPLYGKPRPIEVRAKIRAHHRNCSGAKNSQAKKWKITSPRGESYYCEGDLKQFCEEHQLALGILKRYVDKGPYKMERFSRIRGFAKNTEGWEMIKL